MDFKLEYLDVLALDSIYNLLSFNKTLKFYNEKTESFENLEKDQTTYPKITKAVYGQLS